MSVFDSPRLLADMGGTVARFTIETAPGTFEHMASLRCGEHADFPAAVGAYLAGLPAGGLAPIRHAAIAIANPVEGDVVRMNNGHWCFSIEQMRQRLGLETLVVVNGFTALAAALPRLAPPADQPSALLGQIQRALDNLSPAERRVADHVLAHPRSALSDPIAEIARAASVSQPTVIRFCRSLGCDGLSDFKLRLASGLSGTIPLTHTQVTGEDSMLELGVKVLGNTASAILQVREQLNRDLLVRAIDLLAAAPRIDFYAVGHSGVVADDAQFKFLRFGVPSSSYTDPRLQLLAVNVLRPGDVAVIISSSGRIDDLLAVAEAARARGVAVVAITASHSPLARKADVALLVDHVEDVATQVPMVSRILHLLVIDILAVGVAMRLGAPGVAALPREAIAGLDENRPEPQAPAARRAGMGISAAGPLAHLTSHSR